MEMDIGLYRRYLNDLIKEALQNSDGSKAGVAAYLAEKSPAGRLAAHKQIKNQALEDARRAFDEHRHWPMEIILSQLGVETGERK